MRTSGLQLGARAHTLAVAVDRSSLSLRSDENGSYDAQESESAVFSIEPILADLKQRKRALLVVSGGQDRKQ